MTLDLCIESHEDSINHEEEPPLRNFIKTYKQYCFCEPQNLFFQMAKFEQRAYDDSLYLEANIFLPERIKNSVTKRKAEFLAGRYVAKKALEQLTIENFPLLSDKKRCPLWPPSITGSISHTDDTAACVIARKKHVAFLGLDIENWLDEKLAQEIYSQIIDCREKELILAENRPFNEGLTLIFSAKESIFKALYPEVKDYFDFSAAKLIHIDRSHGLVEFSLTQNLGPRFCAGKKLQVRFQLLAKGIMTLLAITDIPPSLPYLQV